MRVNEHTDIDDISRDVEFVEASELETLLGQSRDQFAAVVLKELVDNALDAAEARRIPPVISIEIDRADGLVHLSVTDNGGGIPGAAIARMVNFKRRTSDKLALRAPTRGQHGYGIKLAIGIPYALGSRAPIVLETQGVRYAIRASITPTGEVEVDHVPEAISLADGTRLTVPLPVTDQEFEPVWWARAFALFNPHAEIKIRETCVGSEQAHSDIRRGEHFLHDWVRDDDDAWWRRLSRIVEPRETDAVYLPTVVFPDPWRKFALPKDRTSPFWYDAMALKRFITARNNAAQRAGREESLYDFVQRFRGLTDGRRARAVCAKLPQIQGVSALTHDAAAIEQLLDAMQAIAKKPPSPHVLGAVGEAHLQTRIDSWFGVRRWWYRTAANVIDGVPWIIEVALAETERPGAFFSGVNFSPTAEDPLALTYLRGPYYWAFGVQDFFKQGHVPVPEPGNPARFHVAAAIHLVCPVVTFEERSKTRLAVPFRMANVIAQTLWSAVEERYHEEEQRRKGGGPARRTAAAGQPNAAPAQGRKSAKAAVFEIIYELYLQETDHERIALSVRDLYYAVRPEIEPRIQTKNGLNFHYFSQTLLPEYRRNHRPMPLLYYKPRGVLYEPHTGREIPLGTREVESYSFPAWL